MEYFYSKIDNKLLHIIQRGSEMEQMPVGRIEIVPSDNFIQCAALRMNTGKTFKPHKHIYKKRTHHKQIAQESWVVIKGSVKCFFYDIDDSVLAEPVLYAGDASFTLAGGHTYLVLDDSTIVFEFKTGPYEGLEFDKKFI